MFREKIFSFLMLAAVSILLVSSASLTTDNKQSPASFAVRASLESKDIAKDIVKTVANIKVEALTDSIATKVEENVDKASRDIYQAKLAQEEARRQAEAERIARERQEAQVKASQAASSSLSGIEAEVLNLINSTRAQHGLSQLTPNQALIDLARIRSNDMVAKNYFSHYTPEGTNIKHLLNQYGVRYANFGENLGNASPASYGSPGAFLNAWMNSPSHRDNMLKGYYTSIGVGVVDGGGRRVVTVLFIR
jgi:uncharacterized protein YkwD